MDKRRAYLRARSQNSTGQFYQRELPCLLEVLQQQTTAEQPTAIQANVIIVDGYTTLDANGRHGLGWYLAQAMAATGRPAVAVIGVAKTAFTGATHAITLKRGHSQRPLYVTALGMNAQQAAQHIQTMHGPHRLPTLLKRVDRLCREAP